MKAPNPGAIDSRIGCRGTLRRWTQGARWRSRHTSRAYQPTFPFVVNNDPAITGIMFNTARAPFDKLDVRWALLLAIDIAEYIGIAVDGAGTLSPVHIPSLGPYPEDLHRADGRLVERIHHWIWATARPSHPMTPMRRSALVEYARGRGYVVPDDQAESGKAFGYGWYKYAPDVAENCWSRTASPRMPMAYGCCPMARPGRSLA